MKACVIGLIFTPDIKKVLLLTMPGGDASAIAPIMSRVNRRGVDTDKILSGQVRALTGLNIQDWQPVGGYNLTNGFFEIYRTLGQFKPRQPNKDFIPVWMEVESLRDMTGFPSETWQIIRDARRLGPERQRVIAAPEKTDFILRLELRGITPPIWRRVRVPASITLPTMHEVIQAVFGWSNIHPYRFIAAGVPFQPTSEGVELIEEGYITDGLELHFLLNQVKAAISYEYDFDSDWRHRVILEKIENRKDGRLECLDGKRGSPPEDCGGPSYAARVKRGRGFDIHGFDIEIARERMADIFDPYSSF
jgi:hypothetical protein